MAVFGMSEEEKKRISDQHKELEKKNREKSGKNLLIWKKNQSYLTIVIRVDQGGDMYD